MDISNTFLGHKQTQITVTIYYFVLIQLENTFSLLLHEQASFVLISQT
jgi:hypothetical protein